MAQVGDALIGSLEYAEDLFFPESAARMAAQLVVLLRNIVAEPDAPVRSLSLVPADEARTQLELWRGTRRPPPPAVTVIEMWQRRVAAQPEALALVAGGDRLTYRQLDQRATAVARRLRAHGIGVGSTVALLLPRSIDMIAAVLGVLRSGAAYVPLEPSTPGQRVAYIVEHCGAAALIAPRAYADRATPLGCPIVLWSDEIDAAPDRAATPLAVDAGADDAAYVIYTSGTTGRPKGVTVLHRNLVHYATCAAEAFRITPGDRVLQFASLAFDTSVEEIFATLTAGATLVLRDDAMLASAPRFFARCGELGITLLDLPTAYWNHLVASASPSDWARAAALRLVVIGGEKVTVERLRRWHETVGPRLELLNTYGPTEATVAATIADLTHVSLDELATMTEVPIGRPFPNCQVYVLDAALRPVPVGAPGELYIGGAGVARGYHNAPELTASAFLPDPFAADPAGRIYRTGDKVRYLSDGRLQYLGRLDQQVKIRGYRVELGEIEAVLAACPGVRAAAVVAEAAGATEPRLLAYLECTQPSSLSAGEVRAFAKERLPHYMVPSLFVGLASLPMSSSGKIDRNRLPSPQPDTILHDDHHVPASNPIEARMADVWKRVLQLDQVGVHDNFFDLGGHSLLLPMLLTEIRREFDCDVAMVALLERPTISASARLFEPAKTATDGAVDRGKARASRMRELALHKRRRR
jgi:amino acid adenylation domain-containing protein